MLGGEGEEMVSGNMIPCYYARLTVIFSLSSLISLSGAAGRWQQIRFRAIRLCPQGSGRDTFFLQSAGPHQEVN